MQSTMMKRILFGIAVDILAISANAQTSSSDPTLMTVDGQPVSRSEFESIYKKNNKDAPVTKEALDEYLDLFINYKLKVRAAEAAGMDTAAKFKTELEGYRAQLARPYLIDRGLNDQLMQEAFPGRVASDGAIDRVIKHIQQKFDALGAGFDHLEGVHGAGYRYRAARRRS